MHSDRRDRFWYPGAKCHYPPDIRRLSRLPDTPEDYFLDLGGIDPRAGQQQADSCFAQFNRLGIGQDCACLGKRSSDSIHDENWFFHTTYVSLSAKRGLSLPTVYCLLSTVHCRV
jgi:hypothetical protein